MPEPKSLTCPTCGAPLNYDGKSTSVQCTFCRNVFIMDVPKPDMETKSWLDIPVRTPVPEDILELLKVGKKDEAIRRYREVYDVSSAKAKYAIERIEKGNLHDPEFGFQAPQAETSKPKSTRKRWPWSLG